MRLSPGNRLKSRFWPKRGNGASKLVPRGPKMVPSGSKMLQNAPKIVPKLPQSCPTVVTARSPSMVFKHTRGNACTCTCTCTNTTFAQKRQHLHKHEYYQARWRFWERMRQWIYPAAHRANAVPEPSPQTFLQSNIRLN